MAASGTILLGLVLLGANPSAKWIGQDGHDLVGPSAEPKSSDVQDVHIVLSGLPPERRIVWLNITGEGGDEWRFSDQNHGPYRAEVRQAPNARVADVFIEPTHPEKGRGFTIRLRFDDGTTAELALQGRKADPHLRMPGAALGANWLGQDRQDWVGPGLGVGPDGLQDVRIGLTSLSTKTKVKAIALEGPARSRWQYGLNPQGHPNAELFPHPDDPAQGDLYIHADRDLNGQKLLLTVTYENGTTDAATLTAGRSDPQLKMPRAALPTLMPNTITAQWLGQDGNPGGDVRVVLSGLPTSRTVVAAVLSDSVRATWVYRRDDRASLTTDPGALPLVARRGATRDQVELLFAPIRDETDATLTLRLVFDDGGLAVAQFPGGRCDPGLRAQAPPATATTAKPGDDLNDLANRFGTVNLVQGTYVLSRPLVLNQPVALVGAPGAIVLFTQGPSEPPWTAAIKVHRGATALSGFAIRFGGPIRWKTDVSWGPAVIGATDNLDAVPSDPKINLTFRNLDLEGPPAANPSARETAPHLLRLIGAGGGAIVGNVLRGGSIELCDGPWRIEDNTYRGTPQGTVCYGVISAHNPFDLVVRNNKAQPVGPSGKTWRFLVMTGQGTNDRVEDNTVVGIGPRDDDTIPWANAPEVVLTESYTLRFEGKPAAVAADGRLLRIPRPQGDAPLSGDVVAVLSGPHAGEWRRIAQSVASSTYLLETPLPSGTEEAVIAVGPGFVNETIRGNTIDSRGGLKAANLVLSGNHYGTRILDNHLIGAGESFQVFAYATEAPVLWGWSHVPFLGGTIAGNTIEDSEGGGVLGVHHGPPVKTNQGRVYMAVSLRNNTVRWSEAFLSRRPAKGAQPPVGITIGFPGGIDPAELVVNTEGNRLDAPSEVRKALPLRVIGALIDGKPVVEQRLPLSADPSTPQVGRK